MVKEFVSSTENNPVNAEITTETQTVTDSSAEIKDVELSVEERARTMGWKPLEEYEGPKENWKGPGAFIKDSELFGALKRQDSTIKELKATLDDLKHHISKSEEKGYKQALKDLESQQRTAIENFDTELLQKTNDEYLELKAQMEKTAAHTYVAPVPAPKDKEELAFEQRNADWYNDNTSENKEMKDEALAISTALARNRPELSVAEHIQLVEQKIKRMYPDRFKNKKRDEPTIVDSSTVGKSNASYINRKNLDPRVLIAAERFVKHGVYKSIDEYLKDAKDKGVI